MLKDISSEKYIGNTTTNHGADRANCRHSGIQHEGHTQVCPRSMRRQTMDGPHFIHIRATDPRYRSQYTLSMYYII